jgi:acetamidase/formamidase
MDVRVMTAGARLYLPVLNSGALFSAGDAHAAQGDGEVCINGIECPAGVSLRFHLHKHRGIAAPLVDAPPRPAGKSGEWLVVESATDALGAARNATSRMVDLLCEHWGLSPEHAYLLCSVAMNLRLSQVVNEPMITVAAGIAKEILPERKLFSPC